MRLRFSLKVLLKDHVTNQEIDPALCRPDDIEIERLIRMGVLLPETAAETESSDQVPTKLTTKIRT